jgi:hypothetical protein
MIYNMPTHYPDTFDRGSPANQCFAANTHQAVADAEEVIGFVTGIIGSP